MAPEQLKYLAALSCLQNFGPRKYQKLLEIFKEPKNIWEASEKDIMKAGILSDKLSTCFFALRRQMDPDRLLAGIYEQNIKLLERENLSYPPLLRHIYDPPFLLYVKGEGSLADNAWLAVVGSRKMTAYGRETAYRLGQEIAALGIGVVSGLARGIDTWAHKGALKAGGTTAAVLGCGLDYFYPPENKNLMREIEACGYLLSEYAPGTEPKPYYFPLRNRIISGMSLGVIIVEAAEKSGALITADLALEQGREVFAVPGPVNSLQSRGCHKLIKQGAKLLSDIDDVLEELALSLQETATAKSGAVTARKKDISSEENKLLDVISFSPMYLEDIIAAAECPVEKCLASLSRLELKGRIARGQGNTFIRIK